LNEGSSNASPNQQLRRLASQVDALRQSMEMTAQGNTPDFGKWNGFANFFRTYNKLASSYRNLTGHQDVIVYDLDKLPRWGEVVWHQAKNYFEQAYTDTLFLSACLNEYASPQMTSRSEVQDLISSNLRRVVFDVPANEVAVQHAVETLFVGRGYQKGFDYDRETGRVKFSGKEFVPDFLFKSFNLVIEVKLIKNKSHISKCVEEMSADIPAYLSAYESIIFCVYDLGCIQDVAEFQRGFESNAGVRLCVIKH